MHPLSEHLPDATRFLLESVCLGKPGTADNAAAVVDEARRQALAGPLLQWCRRNPQHPLGKPVADALAADVQDNDVRAMTLVGQTLALQQLLAAKGIRCIVIKGPFLSKRYYGDWGARHAGDIDLLVDEADVQRTDALLQSSGCTRTKPTRPLNERRWRLYLRTQHELGYRGPGDLEVELHWRYADSPLIGVRFDELWQRAVEAEAPAARARQLGDGDTLMQLVIHGAFAGWSRLKWIADLPLVLGRLTPAQVAEQADRATRAGVRGMFDIALALGGAPVPAPSERVLRYVAGRLGTEHPREYGIGSRARHWLDSRHFTNALLDTAALRASVSHCELLMPADFDRLQLPDPLLPALPYVARATRVLARFTPSLP